MKNEWIVYTAQPVMLRNTLVEYINRNDDEGRIRIGEAGDVCWHWVGWWRPLTNDGERGN